jgi:DNA-binding NarL/FixJ family response regulator
VTAIRVLVADDHPVVREGLRSLLAQCQDIKLVGEAATHEELRSVLSYTNPDVLILDIRLGDTNGIELAKRIRHIYPKLKIIVLTSYADDVYLYSALEAGVHAYLLKNAAHEELIETIRTVHRGERTMSLPLISKLMSQFERLAKAQAQHASGLSKQEMQVLHLIADGATTQEIAQAMHWSEATVKRRVQSILDKLGAANRAQAVAEGFRRGLL